MSEVIEKNLDQSNKSKGGLEFNDIVSNYLISTDKNVKNFYYVKAEPKFKTIRCGDYISTSKCNLDHFSFILNKKHKQVLIMLSDNTKTFRDRIYGKSNNGTKIQKMESEISKEFISMFPQYSSYELIYNCFVIFPNSVIGDYKNREQEERQINNCCAEVNYKTGTVSSDNTHWLLDGAFRIGQFVECIKEINKDIDKGVKLSRNSILEKWKELYNTYDLKPALWLKKDIMLKDIEYTKYCLIYKNRSYSLDNIINALEDCGILHKPNISKKTGINLLLNFLG